MDRVTPRVAPASLVEALLGARAAIAFDRDGTVDAVPALCRRVDGETWIGVAPDLAPSDASLDRAVLLLDDGQFWFELRAHTARGRLVRADGTPSGAANDVAWLRFVPIGAVAWNYGALHEEVDA